MRRPQIAILGRSRRRRQRRDPLHDDRLRPQLVTGSLSLAIEIDPPTSATAAAITELPSVDLSVEPIPSKELIATAQESVTVIFTAAPNAAAPSSANVVLTVPTTIAGRPDLTFQTPTVGGASAGVVSASLTVPQTALYSAGTLALIPSPPADQQSPPFSFPETVSPMLAETIPGDSFTINGTLVSAIGTAPAATFVARAFQDGVVVSNAPLTQSNGSIDSFRLLFPSAVTANGHPLTIQLMPQSSADPSFVSGPIAPQANTTALSIMLPAYSNLNQFNLNVRGSDDSAPVGALVHAQTVVGTSSVGATQFARDGLTDANGIVSLSLLPGTAQTALNYQITVDPAGQLPLRHPLRHPGRRDRRWQHGQRRLGADADDDHAGGAADTERHRQGLPGLSAVERDRHRHAGDVGTTAPAPRRPRAPPA